AAAKLQIKVGHVEAGLRSFDRTMPEEINRILTDHCSDYLFAPTEKSKTILLDEGITAEKLFVTGNTIVDAVFQNKKIAEERGSALATLHLKPKEYFLVTLHRQENVDNSSRFASILEGLIKLADKFHREIIYPVHPRSQKMVAKFELDTRGLKLVEPQDYLSFLQLESKASLILTDSGGVQEEACVLGVPCVTLRDNTERPETIEVGANILSGATPVKIMECAELMLSREHKWQNPFGDGNTAKRIISIITGGSNG
ncbi:MAG: UDP-N-acetylglucosamine 2-epimerase (non-hydrolyzing), partial [Chloroflexi bacterium]|nr:UDP-N-acetylglucosamine 2-epimerase (non-hydrolyzing) [Chloroflexota bacterium]